jgi:HEPN domain-containing protein
MKPEDDIREWLKKADEDYNFACSILPDTTFYAQICFHFQQAAEKHLKAYIVGKGLEFRKIHELRKLLLICEKRAPSFSTLREAGDFLSPFYIDTRYPVHWPSTVTREEATKAEGAARKIKGFVEKLLRS